MRGCVYRFTAQKAIIEIQAQGLKTDKALRCLLALLELDVHTAQGYEILPPPLAQRAKHLRTRHNIDLQARDVSFNIGIVLSYDMILRSDSAN